MTDLALPAQLLEMPRSKVEEMLCRANPGVWAELRRGFVNEPFHWEWYYLMLSEQRLCVSAPREHAKSEVFTINGTAWDSIYRPGFQTYVFNNTKELAKKLLERIVRAVASVRPELYDKAIIDTDNQVVFANYAQVTVAGTGSAVRSEHPDRIVGDDVLNDGNTLTSYQRRKTHDWWFGTVSNMAHPGTIRDLPNGKRVAYPPTRIHLVGTPFHKKDLICGMKANPIYRYRRYSGEFLDGELIDGYAVEIG